QRAKPNLLAPGDVVHLPDVAPTGSRLRRGEQNSYCASPPMTTLRVRLARAVEGETRPIAGVPFRIIVEHTSIEGTTTADGDVEASIPARSRAARLEL